MFARSVLIAGFCIGCLAGCGEGDKLYPVQGKLFVSGTPAGNASIFFHPRDKTQLRIPIARTEADGSYRLMTMQPGDGAAAGEYDVVVVWPDYSIPRDECVDPLHDRLKLRYADPAKTELHATVRPEVNEFTFHAHMGGGGWSFPRRRDTEK
jgi:hypothetical protein